jgi:hypothetical protein
MCFLALNELLRDKRARPVLLACCGLEFALGKGDDMKSRESTTSPILSAMLMNIRELFRRYEIAALFAGAVFVGILYLSACGTEPVGDEEAPGDPNVIAVSLDSQKNKGLVMTEAMRQEIQSTIKATGIISPNQSRFASTSCRWAEVSWRRFM